MIELLISFAVGVASGFLANLAYQRYQQAQKRRAVRLPIARLFALGEGEVLFVLPHHKPHENRPTANFAVDDVSAMRKVNQVLTAMGRPMAKFKHAGSLNGDDLKKNLICIGGTVRNSETKRVLETPVDGAPISVRPAAEHPERLALIHGTTRYSSTSYIAPDDDPVSRRGDIGLFLRRRNPYNPDAVEIVFAGIRGIGTWGAADMVCNHPKLLLAELGTRDGDAVFAIMDVVYESFDIQGGKVSVARFYR